MATPDNIARPARPHDPKGFASAFTELTGVPISPRWVQSACKRGEIKSGGRGRYYIPASEVERLALALGLLEVSA